MGRFTPLMDKTISVSRPVPGAPTRQYTTVATGISAAVASASQGRIAQYAMRQLTIDKTFYVEADLATLIPNGLNIGDVIVYAGVNYTVMGIDLFDNTAINPTPLYQIDSQRRAS